MEQEVLFTLEDDGGTPWEGIPQKRMPDPVWDALVACVGEPTNKNERGRMNKACQLIRESLQKERDATTYDNVHALVRQRYFKMRTVWPGIPPTEMALASNWKTLKPTVKRICANEKAGWDDENKVFVRASPEQLSALKKSLG